MPKPKSSTLDVSLPGASGRDFEFELRQLLDARQSESFKAQYLHDECFSKYLDEDLVPASVRRAAAIAKWQKAEHRNRDTNMRLYLAAEDLGWITGEELLARVRSKIAWLLGTMEYPEVLRGAVFTNGASTRVRRSPVAACRKLTGELHISSSAVKHWIAAHMGTQLLEQDLRIQESSVLFTVPKKSDIDRCACKEPEGNMLLQRSVGLAIRRKLRKVGINLTDQGRNQKLASRAWKDGLATIDLSSASDTISRQLVMNVLPFDWWSLLDDLRVHSTQVDGVDQTLEMFSSMGNGFTFELETLIFWAVTSVVARGCGVLSPTISVYGDDIICDTSIVPRLMRVFNWLGFIPNAKKTHFKGPFRESCGRHYWRDFDVTPFYVRGRVATLLDLINTLNHLLEWDGRGWGFFTCPDTARFWRRWMRLVPPAFWGGVSPSDPSCLVTGHGPRKRIVPQTKKLERGEAGAYRLWHLTKFASFESSPSEGFEVDPRVVVAYRKEKHRTCGERSVWDPLCAFGAEDQTEGTR